MNPLASLEWYVHHQWFYRVVNPYTMEIWFWSIDSSMLNNAIYCLPQLFVSLLQQMRNRLQIIGALFISPRWLKREFHQAHVIQSLTITVHWSPYPLFTGRFWETEFLCRVVLPHRNRRPFSAPGIYVWLEGVLWLAQKLYCNNYKD